MTTPQADGVYPRVNASLLSKFPNMIVSVVGKYTGNGTLQCADGTVQLNLEQAVEVPMEDTVLEVIGQAMENGVVAVRMVVCDGRNGRTYSLTSARRCSLDAPSRPTQISTSTTK